MFTSFGDLTSSYRHSSSNLWAILFHVEGNILIRVLPFCILNCLLLALVDEFRKRDNLGFSATGHGLLTLLVSFLVINKVNLAYERFRLARTHVGNAFLHLRELNQLMICFSASRLKAISSDISKDKDQEASRQVISHWRSENVANTIHLLDCIKQVVQNERIAKYFARNKQKYLRELSTESVTDPLTLVHSLRLRLYTPDFHLELLERVCLVNKLDAFLESYHHLLDLASTPLPFALVQMGRAFLFLWTFSMPLVLLQGPFTDLWTAIVFLFFLTYGFVGLELVSMKLASPFGDGIHDIQVTNMRDATVVGIEQDMEATVHLKYDDTASFQRRMQFQKLKQTLPQQSSGHEEATQGKVPQGRLRPFSSSNPNVDAAVSYHIMSLDNQHHSTGHLL